MLGVFEIHEPRSVAAASHLLTEHGPEAAVYAGGTELLVVMKDRLVHYPHLVNIKTIPGLDRIALDAEEEALRIGPLATHRAIERAAPVRERLPQLAEVAANIANVRVRSTGTIGGNLCFAEPHSDPAALLVALDAVLTLTDGAGSRTVPAEAFFVGLFETSRRHDELLTDILVPLPSPKTGVAYERFKTHERPSAAVATVIDLTDGAITNARLVVGSIGERPVRVPAAEAQLRGQRPSPALFAAAADIVRDAVEPTSDPFESTDYKRHLARALTVQSLAAAVGRVTGRNGSNDDA